jgi:putative resolvase
MSLRFGAQDHSSWIEMLSSAHAIFWSALPTGAPGSTLKASAALEIALGADLGLRTAERCLSVCPSESSFMLRCVRLSEWAKQEGIHYQTAWKWFKDGTLPVPATQTATGTILIDAPRPAGVPGVGLYARVSSHDQREDLERQVGRSVAEVGSGLNGSRTKLKRLLGDPTVGTVVVEHRERLARFGVEYIEAALRAQGRRLVVVEEREVDDDLVRDITEVLTSMCARLYGRRSAKRRAEAALAAAGEAT